MMETILFSFILILIIIWIMLGILYFYMRYVSPYGILIKKNKKGNEQTKENEATKEKDGQKEEGKEDQAEFVLIGKSRSISPIIPQVPLLLHLKIQSRIVIILHLRTPKRKRT